MRTVGRSGVFRQPVYKQWQRLGQERKSKKNEAVPQLTNSSSFNEGDHEKKKKTGWQHQRELCARIGRFNRKV